MLIAQVVRMEGNYQVLLVAVLWVECLIRVPAVLEWS